MSSDNRFLPFEQALNQLLEDNDVVVKSHRVDLQKAHKQVLAQAIVAPIDVPGHDNSAMDGYAFFHRDLASFEHLQIVGTAYAGHPYDQTIEPGQCIRIMTGAAIPQGCDTVEMQENIRLKTEEGVDYISFKQIIKKGQNLRYQGEDIKADSILFDKGYRLKSCDIGLLASIGIAELEVYQALKVAILSTGDELQEPGKPLAVGDIYDSNRYVVANMLNNLGYEVVDLGIIPDDKAQLHEAFTAAIESADVVVSSGGVSVGEADHTKEILESLGQMHFWKVAIKPGKPFAYGQFNSDSDKHRATRFLGLPGNPVSAVVTLHQLAIPTLQKMAGEKPTRQKPLYLPLAETIEKKPGRLEFMRATIVNNNALTEVQALKGQGSGILSSFSKSSGYILLAPQQTLFAKGERVPFLLYDMALD